MVIDPDNLDADVFMWGPDGGLSDEWQDWASSDTVEDFSVWLRRHIVAYNESVQPSGILSCSGLPSIC
jgi:hypothetical protein